MHIRHDFRRRGILGSALLFVMTATACSGTDVDETPTSVPASASAASSGISPNMERYLQVANSANTETSKTLAAAGARPSVIEQDGGLRTMTIRDESRDEWAAGEYRLVVNCAGAGTLYAYFQLGEKSEIAELSACSPTATTTDVALTLKAGAINSTVIVIPVGEVQAAISYQIQKS